MPNKGELFEPTAELFLDLGVDLRDLKASRKLRTTVRNVDVFLMNVFDIPMAVADRYVGAGLTGGDVFAEELAKRPTFPARDIITQKYNFGECRLVLAASPETVPRITRVIAPNGRAEWRADNPLRIATRYPKLAELYMNAFDPSFGWGGEMPPLRISSLNGAIETAVAMGMADAIIDLVASGETLRANGLVEVYSFSKYSAMMLWKGEFQAR
ncbi:MAG: ATP phosphoribosyltransferase [Candidatus Micrarchaeota archaeon]